MKQSTSKIYLVLILRLIDATAVEKQITPAPNSISNKWPYNTCTLIQADRGREPRAKERQKYYGLPAKVVRKKRKKNTAALLSPVVGHYTDDNGIHFHISRSVARLRALLFHSGYWPIQILTFACKFRSLETE